MTPPSALYATSSLCQTANAFYRHLEAGDLDEWASLWTDDGVYLNPFAAEPFPTERVAGRDPVVATVGAMRACFSRLVFLGHKKELALAPDADTYILYVSGDWRFATPKTSSLQHSHFHHRLEILDGQVTGWVDYTNPLTRRNRQIVPAAAAQPAGRNRQGTRSPSAEDLDYRQILSPAPAQRTSRQTEPPSPAALENAALARAT